MDLAASSISLAVKDLEAPRSSYETFGIAACDADAARNGLILEHRDRAIGLFRGMFEKNRVSFNLGWEQEPRDLPSFNDVRGIQRRLEARGRPLVSEADATTTGPDGFVAVDAVRNPILVAQHR